MSSLTVEDDQKWVPTHVQVTVLRGRGLRGKGKHGTSDVYTIIQLGKEKYSTCVAEKTTEPEWREECTFELQPGVLQTGAGSTELVLTVMHRALIGLDVFLGQAVVHLDKVFHESRCVKNEWYRLNSKTGKKEKERGDIQVTVQFTRNNLTASMYDLVMKDKTASTFGKLKERMRGKRRSSDEDSSSAVLPGGYGSLSRMRQRLPSDGGGEEDYEDDEGGEVRRSKMRTFFLRGKLRKSSDTRSSTSLGSESSESSSRGGSLSPTAGISVVVSDLSNSPSNSSNLTVDSPDHTANTSPKSSSSLRCEFGDEVSEISITVPTPIVCVNGSHVYDVQPLDSGKPATTLDLGLLQKSLPLSVSLQNLNPRVSTETPVGLVGDGRRWSFDKPDEEEKAAIAAALEQSGPMLADEEVEEQATRHRAAASSTAELESQGRKQRRNFFSQGRSQCKDESEQAAAPAAEERHKGWFGSKESPSKPSLVVSPKLEPSTDPHPPPLPPLGPRVDPDSPVSPLHHTNPFCPSQSTPPPLSPCNPFFSLLQHNPFYDDMLKPSAPPLPYLSSSRPPISQLFPQASSPNLSEHSVTGAAANSKRPLPPTPLSRRPSNPFTAAGELEPDSEWDECFEAFAAGRLQSPEDPTTDCRTQQNAAEGCSDKGAPPPPPLTPADQNTDPQPSPEPGSEAHNANANHFDSFAQLLETIPEHAGFENDHLARDSPNWAVSTETNQANVTTNASGLTDTNTHQTLRHASSVKLDSSSPDPGSSGLGSSAEEDFLSCLSSYSDKFSASSSEEAEAQNFLAFEKSTAVKKLSESEDDPADGSNDRSLDQHTVIQHGGADEKDEPKLSDPQSRSDSSHSGSRSQEEELNDSDAPDVLAASTPGDLGGVRPPFHIITSSPDVRRGSPDSPLESTTLGAPGARRCSPVPFGLFDDLLSISPTRGLDKTLLLLPVGVSDQSSSSFVHSLYVSTDSQGYQTCASQPSSKCSSASEPDETLHSANSTLCGELSGLRRGSADAREPSNEESDPTPAGDFSLEELLCMSPRRPSGGGDEFTKQAPTLHRSQSEGALIPAFDELLLPSFGSDPGAIQEESSPAPPGPPLPSLTSFTPSLIPGSGRSSSPPVELCSLPPVADATARSSPSAASQPMSPQEIRQQQQQAANQQNSPHPVKPMTTGMQAEEKRTEGRSVLATGLEKLKSTIHPGRSSHPSEPETDRKKPGTEGAGSYYHLNHSELVALLVQRESELKRQKTEFERQKCLLAKREVELRKLKPQVRDLEDYIDTLLVRIMEQKPTLLQVRSKLK